MLNRGPAPPSVVPALVVLFGSMGATSASVPAVIPVLSAGRGGSLEEFARAVPALFLGLLVGVLLSSALGRVAAPRSVCLMGAVVQGLGFLGLAVSTTPMVFASVAVIVGIGFGLVEAGASVLARIASGASTARLLSALTGTVAVVAAGVPLLVALTPLGRSPHLLFLLIALVHAVGATLVARGSVPVERGRPAPASGGRAGDGGEDDVPRGQTRALAVLVPIGAALALYVGVETVYAGWSATIPLVAFELDARSAALGTSVFWVLLAVGRYLAAVVLRSRVPAVAYLLGSVAAAAAFLIVTATTMPTDPLVATLALGGAVAALGPCYSLILGLGLARIPVARARWATGVLVACGAGGGALVPAALLATTSGPTNAMVFALTGGLTIVAGLLVVVRSRRPLSSEGAMPVGPDGRQAREPR